MGTQKNHLNEMVLLSIHNIIVKPDGLEDISKFYAKKYA